MHARHAVITAVVGLTLSGFPQPLAADTFRSDKHGYMLEIPEGWQSVPLETVEESLSALRKMDTGVITEAVFQPGDPAEGLSFPRLHVQVQTYASFEMPRQPYDDELPLYLEEIKNLDLSTVLEHTVTSAAPQLSFKPFDIALDAEQRRITWSVDLPQDDGSVARGDYDRFIGHEAFVILALFSRPDGAAQLAAARQAMRGSFRFDSNRAFVPGVAPQPETTDWARVALMFGGLLFAGAAILVIEHFRRKGRTATT